jgi:sulfur carrier protein ThiS
MGPVRRPEGAGDRVTIELGPGDGVEALLQTLGYSPVEARHIVVLRNGVRAQGSDGLNEGDRVTLALPIGGG